MRLLRGDVLQEAVHQAPRWEARRGVHRPRLRPAQGFLRARPDAARDPLPYDAAHRARVEGSAEASRRRPRRRGRLFHSRGLYGIALAEGPEVPRRRD